MAIFDDSNDERTETATPYRREEFRKQGTVAMSREVLSVLMMGAVAFAIYGSSHSLLKQFGELAHQYFGFFIKGEFEKTQLLEMRWGIFKSLLIMVFPIVATAMVAGIISSVAQVGFYITTEPLMPKWDRLNPINGFQRMFSGQGLIEVVKALIKIAIAGWVVWKFIKSEAPQVGALYQKNTLEIVTLTMTSCGKLMVSLLLFLAVIAGLDYAFQRFQLEKKMKMTRREAKEEFKLREGDPLIKSRIKSIQRKIASRRMMESVPKSTVIVTNPTHLAVALQYESGMQAPKVVAKGAGFVADKIKEIARANKIPIVENKPLARNMFKNIPIGQFIPRELYKAVAEVLSYVYKLRGIVRGAA
ncbi:MAG: flagellar biosynthesis protein FlhB [Proteobacteria bacterium]|nr:flagellar biosynthesis protein FlhB [Pseudomonadota bacterium]NBY19555.1 flagellar biosynthesis protein FlhB [bacterium]